jgi:transposase
MGRRISSKPSADAGLSWKEGRRLQAWDLHQRSWTNVEIAEALGVTGAAVGQWINAAQDGGSAALQARSRRGQAARLTEAQGTQLPSLLDRGPEHYGFVGTFWSRPRIAEVIERTFGVRYSPQHVGRLLHQLGWSSHKPLVRASQRDEASIDAWLQETWPALLEQAEIEGRTIVFLDEAAFYMRPTVSRTWSPAGEEVELEGPFTRDHLSVIGGLTWEGSLYLQAQPTSLGSAGVIRFLRHLLQHIPGRILLLWDGAKIHKSEEMRDFLALDREQRLVHEHFPPYAPEVDPQEYVWRHLKHVDLRNLTSYSLDQLWQRLRRATQHLRGRVGVLKSFIKRANLR